VDINIFSTNQEYKALESFLATRLYEFNAAATGVSDAQYLGLQIEGAGNEVASHPEGHSNIWFTKALVNGP
jgi:hypothetical protein